MQLVYFNDLHKNLGCNKGRTAKISIIPVTFTVPPVKFYALPFSSASFFSHSLSPPSSNRPVRTDISIAQKTCVFRPVDISVPLTKCNKLIYQSVYSRLGDSGGKPLPSAHCVRSHLPQGDGFSGGGKVSHTAQRRPLGGAAERSEAEGVTPPPPCGWLP